MDGVSECSKGRHGFGRIGAGLKRLELATFVPAGIALPIEQDQHLPATSHHSLRFDRLEPATLYAYRVQGEGRWSE